MTDPITRLETAVRTVLNGPPGLPDVAVANESRNRVVVTLWEKLLPAESAPHIRRVAEILAARGFDTEHSLTRVRVWLAGERPKLRTPDFACSRRRKP